MQFILYRNKVSTGSYLLPALYIASSTPLFCPSQQASIRRLAVKSSNPGPRLPFLTPVFIQFRQCFPVSLSLDRRTTPGCCGLARPPFTTQPAPQEVPSSVDNWAHRDAPAHSNVGRLSHMPTASLGSSRGNSMGIPRGFRGTSRPSASPNLKPCQTLGCTTGVFSLIADLQTAWCAAGVLSILTKPQAASSSKLLPCQWRPRLNHGNGLPPSRPAYW